MKKLIYVACMLIPLIGCKNSQDDEEGNCLLIPQQQMVALYDDSGNPVDSIINDTVNEEYPILSIEEIDDNRALINASYPNDTIAHKGWIDCKYLGTYTIDATGYMLKLRREPSEDAEVVDSIQNPTWGIFYNVIDCKGSWLKIKGHGKNGWLMPQDQCDNPYTTCC